MPISVEDAASVPRSTDYLNGLKKVLRVIRAQ